MDISSEVSEVYTAILSHALPGPDPSRPERFLRSPGYCRPFADRKAILSKLRKKFSDEQLQRAGVLQSRGVAPGKFKVVLHPDLASAQQPWIAIRDERGAVADIVGQHGCVSGKTIPLLAARHDALIRRHVSDCKSIFATFSVEDAAVLRALSLPAIPATGLASLNHKQANQYRTLLLDGLNLAASEPVKSSVGERNQVAPSTNGTTTVVPPRKKLRDRWGQEHPVYRLVLVGWSPANASAAEPQQLAETVRGLGTIHEDGDLSLQIWRETEESLGELLRVIQDKKPQPIYDAIDKATYENCELAIDSCRLPPAERPLADNPIEEMFRNFYRAVNDPHSEQWIEYRNQIVNCYQARQLIPLRMQAMFTSNGRQSCYRWLLADLLELQLTTSLEDTIAIARNTRMGRIASPILDTLTSKKFELIDRIIELAALCK